MGRGWSLRLRIFLFFALLVVGAWIAIAGGLMLGYRRLGAPEAASAFLIGGIVASFALTGLAAWIWLLFDENVSKPVERLASDLRARTHADVAHEIDQRPGRYLGDLAPAAADAAANLTESRSALAEAVARETVRVAAENARLAAILRDVPAGVILASPDHRIVLYNTQAAALLEGAGELGLDRPLFGLLREGPVRHAFDQLQRDADRDVAADLVCATSDGQQVLQGQMRLVRNDDGATSGYVLTLRDVTADLSVHAAREHLLRDFIESVRRPAANLQTTLDVLEDSSLPAEQRARLQSAVATETGALVDCISRFGASEGSGLSTWWPMTEIAAGNIADALQATLEQDGVELASSCDPLLVHCDAYAVVQLLAAAAQTFLGEAQVGRASLTITADGAGALIDLTWDGPPPSIEAVDAWLAGPLSGGYGNYTRRDALDSHGTELWPETVGARARLRMPIRTARPEAGRSPLRPRPDFYDFTLLAAETRGLDDERPLEAMNYVVFDTETTGLAPTQGDEIVQIAAVRIVNGRMLVGEALDMLVDPERPIPASATQIHRISNAMVAGAPTIAEAGRRFHSFCEDSVLVAHNAPFDIAFLRRHEARIGKRLSNPVLDTVLLSAILFGQGAEHSLDALAERMGIGIDPADRHTALGDAKATALVLLKLLPMLREAGLRTLGQTMRECRKHGRLLSTVE